MTTISSSQSGGLSKKSGTRDFFTRASRLFLTVLVVEHLFLHRRLHRAIRLLKSVSAVVRFKVVGEDAYFLAWTTTPWTLAK